jgi:hypothetical protein
VTPWWVAALAIVGGLWLTWAALLFLRTVAVPTYRDARSWWRRTRVGDALTPKKGVYDLGRVADLNKRISARNDHDWVFVPWFAGFGVSKVLVGVVWIERKKKQASVKPRAKRKA